jgi:hypothetical protein
MRRASPPYGFRFHRPSKPCWQLPLCGRKLDLEEVPAVIANVSNHLKAHHLKALSGAGLATAERRGREVPYVLTPLGRQPLSSAA